MNILAQDEQREVAEAQHGDDFGGDKMEPGPSSQLVEPGPPRRQSDMYEDSDEDAQPLENRSGGSSAEEGEVEIDAMVEEGRELLMSGAKHTVNKQGLIRRVQKNRKIQQLYGIPGKRSKIYTDC